MQRGAAAFLPAHPFRAVAATNSSAQQPGSTVAARLPLDERRPGDGGGGDGGGGGGGGGGGEGGEGGGGNREASVVNAVELVCAFLQTADGVLESPEFL